MFYLLLRDDCKRLLTDIVAIDALCFFNQNDQYDENLFFREIKKSYIGFSSNNRSNSILSPIATGNWGCGAFNGKIEFKCKIKYWHVFQVKL